MMQLYPHQEAARFWLREHDRGGLFLDMGMGKTAATLMSLEPRHLPALVIAPKRVAETVWPAEQKTWRPDLSIAVATGDAMARRRALQASADLTVISRDNLASIEEARLREPYSTVILDELSSFKNRSTKRWRMARKVTDAARHVWGLTGTPASNGMMGLWAQTYLCDKGATFGRTLGGFRDMFFTPGFRLPNGTIVEWKPRPGSEETIQRKLRSRYISMRGEDYLTLPPIMFNRIDLELPNPIWARYNQLQQTLVADFKLLGGEIHTAMNASVLTGKLSQLVAGFVFNDDTVDGSYEWFHDAKMDAVKDAVEEANGSPVLLFYRFRPEREHLLQALPGARTIEEHGVIDDWNAGKVPVLLSHPQSAGHGLNLQKSAHTIVWSTIPWSLEEWDQANARLHRMGQTHPVVVNMVMARGSIDESIRHRLIDRASIQDALMGSLRIA